MRGGDCRGERGERGDVCVGGGGVGAGVGGGNHLILKKVSAVHREDTSECTPRADEQPAVHTPLPSLLLGPPSSLNQEPGRMVAGMLRCDLLVEHFSRLDQLIVPPRLMLVIGASLIWRVLRARRSPNEIRL